MRIPSRPGVLRRYFERNDGHLMDKWLHYFPIYERHFERFRGRRPRVLEIGISHGGSLEMWRRYFGRHATIVGIDIDPRVRELAAPGLEIHVGSQSDPAFLAALTERHGGFDIVIDDGSHRFADQRASLDALWPSLAEGGVYLVEDVHSSYLPNFGGGRGVDDTFIGDVKERIDDLHGFWIEGQRPLDSQSQRPDRTSVNDWTTTIRAIHVYDSIVVLDKATRGRPERRRTGRPAFETLYGHPADSLIDEDHRRQLESLNRPLARLRRAARDPGAAWTRVRARLDGDRGPATPAG